MEKGCLPQPDPGELPGEWMVQAEWQEMLEGSAQSPEGDHWYSWLHLGVMRYHAGEVEAARQAWERSLALEQSPRARRNLAVRAKLDGRKHSTR